MIELTSTHITDLALGRVQGSEAGKIISIHANVINILSDKGLIALQNNLVPLTPFALVLDNEMDLRSLNLNVGQKIWFSKDSVYGNTLRISIGTSETSSCYLEKSTGHDELESLSRLLEAGKLVLEDQTEVKDGLLDLACRMEIVHGKISIGSPSTESHLVGYISKFLDKSNVEIDLSKKITGMIGLGYGLTPSMDDFIVGLLSLISYFSSCHKVGMFHSSLEKDVRSNLSSTNLISAAFLECATDDRFSRPVLDVYKAICGKSFDDIPSSLEKLVAVGHSSGIDTLNGIIFGVKLVEFLTSP